MRFKRGTHIGENKIDNYMKFCMAFTVVSFAAIFAAAAVGMAPNPYVFLILGWGFTCTMVFVYGILSKSNEITGYSTATLLLSFFAILMAIEILDSEEPGWELVIIYLTLLGLGLSFLLGTYFDKIQWIQSDMYYEMLEQYKKELRGKG